MITVVGSANMDLVSTVPHLPSPGETVLARSHRHTAGGKGANQAIAAARAGAEVHFVARLGMDSYGDALLEGLRGAGVHTDTLLRDANALTGTAHIAVDATGENTIVVAPGANAYLSPEDVERARDTIRASSLVVLQLEIPLVTVKRTVELAREHGVKVVLNPAPAQALEPSFLCSADLLVPNEGELAMLTGMGSPVDPAAAAKLLHSVGCPALVVTLGGEGALVVTDAGVQEVEAPVVEAVDTTGAGDAFIGNLACRLDRGDDLPSAATFACYAASLSVTREGAQGGMPTGDETEQFMRERPA